MPAYHERYPVGTRVRIASAADLDAFQHAWRYHDPLTTAQLAFAGQECIVAQVGFYHGGDPLYVLDGVPGVWHEPCLSNIPAPAV
jgi:hypothetical protein